MSAAGKWILCLNFGSSSLRFALFEQAERDALQARCRGNIQGIGTTRATLQFDSETLPAPTLAGVDSHATAAEALCAWLQTTGLDAEVDTIAHRIVHGGTRPSPQPVDAALLRELQELAPLAPLHQPVALQGLEMLQALLPGRRQLACFDTSFHLTMADTAARYALPELAGLPLPVARRAGFHGLSYQHVSQVMQQRAPRARRLVIAHLGSGASLCAVADGRSQDTTMGLTPLDGVPMSTRSGSIDPGLLLWLQETRGEDAASLTDLLYRRSGWLGLSGESADMRTLLASDAAGARLAIDVFVYQCARAVASLCVPLGGLDALVFTGGIGERAASIRAGIVAQCKWLGLELDDAANAADAEFIARPASRVGIWVVPTDEERTMAVQALQD